LKRNLFLVHALSHQLKVWTSLASDARGSMTMRAAAFFKQLGAVLRCFGSSRYGRQWLQDCQAHNGAAHRRAYECRL